MAGMRQAQDQVMEQLGRIGAEVVRPEGQPEGPIVGIEFLHDQVTDTDLEALAELPLPDLRSLDLSGCVHVTGQGLWSLRGRPGLRTLHLDHTGCNDEVADHLATMPDLISLSLCGTRISEYALRRLSRHKRLCELDLSETGLGDGDLDPLVDISTLRYLYLRGTKLSDEELAILATHPRLHDLDLGDTAVTDAGLAHLAGIPGLVSLRLKGTRVTDAGLAHLRGLTLLHDLDLAETVIGDPGLVHLPLETLGVLDLNGTAVTDAGVASLGGVERLWCLSLARTRVTNVSVHPLSQMNNLRHLNLSCTAVTETGAIRLRRALPRADVQWSQKR